MKGEAWQGASGVLVYSSISIPESTMRKPPKNTPKQAGITPKTGGKSPKKEGNTHKNEHFPSNFPGKHSLRGDGLFLLAGQKITMPGDATNNQTTGT